MPHLTIEYSSNLDGDIDIAAFCESLRCAMVETGAFPMAGIRVRALRCEHWAIADGEPTHAFIDMSIRLRAGRSDAVRKAAVSHVFSAAETFLRDILNVHSLALSIEMREIDPDLSLKTGSVRKHLTGN